LRHWVANLEANWVAAVELVGPVRARIWKLYMLGAIVTFEMGDIAIHQVLAVKAFEDGTSGMPLTRSEMV
jgi:cyclopropane-fatty-acyl-phospholipid synthase